MAISNEPDIVKAHWIYNHYQEMTADDSTYLYIVVSQDLDEMADAEPTGTTAAAKELEPNNPEQAKAFKEATGKALVKFVDSIHSFDHYQNESAYEYYVQDYLNELLRTDQSYYKDASIEPVLTTIHDKYCKIMLEKTDTEIPWPFAAQSKDNIEQVEEIILKLGHMEDFPELQRNHLQPSRVCFHNCRCAMRIVQS